MARRFGPYDIVDEVGRGGMGVVYRARELALDRDVALKVIADESAAVPVFKARFERESRLAASIDHPHIVSVHAVGEFEGRAYIAMQWVDGGDLRDRLEGGPLTVGDTLRLGAQIADALQAAHDRGLLHRDVKPANVLLRRGPRLNALLGDFGIARAAEVSVDLTATGEVVGTPLYAAPEQFSGLGAEPKSDVYALGCVLFMCLTGQTPFGDQGNVAEVRSAHVRAERPSARARRADVPRELDELVQAALAVDPAQRPSAGALAGALDEIPRVSSASLPAILPLLPEEDEPVDIPPPPGAETTAPMPADDAPDTTAVQRVTGPGPVIQPPAPQRRIGPRPALAAAAAALAVVVVGAVLLLGGGGGDKGSGSKTQASTKTPTPTATQTTEPTATATATPTSTPSAGPTATATLANLPTSFSSPADIRRLPPSGDTGVTAARKVLGRYLTAYSRKDPTAMRNLLNDDVTRAGRLSDGSCGTDQGIDAVAADYEYNITHAAATYAFSGLGDDNALAPDSGAVVSHGLEFALGDTQPEPISFVFIDEGAGLRISQVDAYCKS